MEKDRILEKAREAFNEGLAIIEANDEDGVRLAGEYFDAQKALVCGNAEEEKLWDLGLCYGDEVTAKSLDEQKKACLLLAKLDVPGDLIIKALSAWKVKIKE